MSLTDPAAGSQWSRPEMVAGFSKGAPNAELMQFAARELRRAHGSRLLDLGCGAGRNAIPLAKEGWLVCGLDYSVPMLHAAAERARQDRAAERFLGVLAPMDRLPIRDRSADLVIAHGIWNLARSAAEFRRAVREAARVAKRGAGLFVFTFSRSTLADDDQPIAGEPFVFTQFSGEPQCFLTDRQLVSELASAAFVPDPQVPLRELNRRPRGTTSPGGGPPVIYEGAFRYAP